MRQTTVICVLFEQPPKSAQKKLETAREESLRLAMRQSCDATSAGPRACGTFVLSYQFRIGPSSMQPGRINARK